jgi:peptide/nickel transport system ATP-binding protein
MTPRRTVATSDPVGTGGPVLQVDDLRTVFGTGPRANRAVDGVQLTVERGEILGIVGESGSGKSTLALSLMRLVPPPGRVTAGRVLLDGRDLSTFTEEQMRAVRGAELAMVFQNPMLSLHPGFTVGWQLGEALRAHHPSMSRAEVRSRVVEVLREVGVPDPERRLRAYPHQFSGGMQQRVMIAMALLNRPKVLIADEPTTALDVTIQAQILALLRRLSADHGMAVLLVTHNLGVVASLCQRVAVMYAGQIVEAGPVEAVFARPGHPYTRGLLDSLPESATGPRIVAVPGSPPRAIDDRLVGCRFRPRCRYAESVCETMPDLAPVGPAHTARCWLGQREPGRYASTKGVT